MRISLTYIKLKMINLQTKSSEQNIRILAALKEQNSKFNDDKFTTNFILASALTYNF